MRYRITPADTVTISATGADLAQPTAKRSHLLYSAGDSVQMIAQKATIAPLLVRDCLGIATQEAMTWCKSSIGSQSQEVRQP